MKARGLVLTAAMAASAGAADSAAAQSLLLPGTPDKGVWIEATHSDLKGFDADLPSSVWYVSGRLPLAQQWRAVIDVPFSHAKVKFPELDSESNSVFGNPYLGVEYAASRRVLLEFGVRAPLTTADSESFADVTALLADPQRPEAFAEDMVPVTTAAVVTLPFANGLSLRARGGVTGLFYTGDDESATDAAIDYSAVGSWSRGVARVAFGFSGRWYATNDQGSFAESSIHHAGLSADMLIGRVRPGVSLRLPIDSDYRDITGPSVGAYLQVPLR